jgi:hypothetical protein
MSQEIVGENIIVRVRVSVFDRDTGTFSKQEGFGGAPNDARAEAGNPYKAAYSKALKDACKKWGLGLSLELEEESSEQLPPGYVGKEYGVPPTQEAPAPTPQAPPAQDTQLAPEARHLAQPPASGGLPTPPSVSMAPTPQDQVVQESVTLQQAPPEAPPEAPPAPTPPAPEAPAAAPVPPAPQAPTPATEQVPPPTQQPAAPSQGLPTPPQVSLSKEMPMSKTATISTGEPDRISDVQKAALHGILSYKGVEYNELVKEAFEANGIVKNPIPAAEDLTYQEAVCVVKYGNDKFRRR